jgi:hypothetical protein
MMALEKPYMPDSSVDSSNMEVNLVRQLMRKREVKNDRILLVLRTRKEQRSEPHDA